MHMQMQENGEMHRMASLLENVFGRTKINVSIVHFANMVLTF